MVKPLFENWPDIEARVHAAARVLIACDFDGTLSPIVPRPDEAFILLECKDALRQIVSLPDYDVAILSGRALEDVRDRVGLSGITYSGNHGIEIAGPGISIHDDVAEDARGIMAPLREELARAVQGLTGAFVEDKGVSLSVHYRVSPEELESQIQEAARHVTARAAEDGSIIVIQGKKVLDIRMAGARDKGAALRLMIDAREKAAGAHCLPIYIGDDATDEDAFTEANNAGGISILVGAAGRDTGALYQVDSPSEAADFLRRLPRKGAPPHP